MNTSIQAFGDSGMPDGMPRGGMLSIDDGAMPGGDMNAAPATTTTSTSTSTDMPTGAMLGAGTGEMPIGAMEPAAPQEMPPAGPQAGDSTSAGEMPSGAMIDLGGGGMPIGGMLSAPGSGNGWNMDLANGQAGGCGC